MRTLYICRHAKSSWADPGQDDFERPLNERGLRDAPLMAERFHARGEGADLIVTSPAVRALTTARAFARELGMEDGRFVLEPKLYLAPVDIIQAIVSALPGHVRRVMLFGHNPGSTEAIGHFTGEHAGNLPTCGMARIDFMVNSWDLVGRSLGTLVWSDRPKHQPGSDQ